MFALTPVSFLALAAHAAAFPTLEHMKQITGAEVDENTIAEIARLQALSNAPFVVGRATFDAPIDVSGEHAFVAPNYASGDVRGPCPGLNVLSNHGYLPHNGVATLVQYASAVNQVFNMGVDLGTALAVFGTAVAGNAVSLSPGYSMGGKTSNSANILGNLLGLLGQPVGLSGTHGQYEEDSSATRGDLYSVGNNYELQMTQFMDFYNLQVDSAEPNYSMGVVLQHNMYRFNQSLHTNPYFWYGPIGGTVIRNAAYAFCGRLFANYSTEHPLDGFLSKETLKSFHGVSGPEGAFVKGGERIPENWYRRPTPYGLAEFAVDLGEWSNKFPELLAAGGNTGKVNSFVGIDISNLTGGVYNAQNLLEGNNAVCLGLELLIEFSPSLLHSLYATITAPLKMITDQLGPSITSLNCPQLDTATNGGTDILQSWKNTYPGAAKAGVAI